MFNLIKKYWDIISGTAVGIGLAFLAELKLETVQLYYSIIILILVSIGMMRIIKQAVDKHREKKEKERKQNFIDSMVDGQKSIKAIRLAQNPMKEGEKVGKLFMELWEVSKNVMKKIKEFWDKFKGIALAIALGILTVVETYGGYISSLCGEGTLTINGIAVIPLITLIASIVVGIISNGWTKEQNNQIKALLSTSCPNEVVQSEIKKTLKENEQKLKKFKGVLASLQAELKNLKSEFESKNNTLSAKVEMSNMTPRLATDEDVHIAELDVKEVLTKVEAKNKEIAEVEASIENLNTIISALKSQL